ncbi:MAG: ABC transporter permease [Beutenbergiaceae bacterium]
MNRIKQFAARDPHAVILAGLTLAVLATLIVILGDRFLSPNNLQSMATQVAEFGLLALAMGLAMLLAGIDLSIVSAAVLAAIVGGKFMSGDIIAITPTNEVMVMTLGVVAALLTGVACGAVNGLLIAKLSVPPILATLGTLIFFAGVGMVVTAGRSVPVEISGYKLLGVSTIATIPVIFVLMCGVYAVAGLLLSRTRLGRRIYLFGENSVALRFAGVRTERTVILTYLGIGLIVGLAGIIMLSRVNSARVGFGESYLLQAILVVVLAGFNPYGGRGKVSSLLLGLVLLQSLQSAFTVMRFDPFMKTFIWGASLLVVMAINHLVHLRVQRRRRSSAPPPSEPGEPEPAATAASAS